MLFLQVTFTSQPRMHLGGGSPVSGVPGGPLPFTQCTRLSSQVHGSPTPWTVPPSLSNLPQSIALVWVMPSNSLPSIWLHSPYCPFWQIQISLEKALSLPDLPFRIHSIHPSPRRAFSNTGGGWEVGRHTGLLDHLQASVCTSYFIQAMFKADLVNLNLGSR